MEKTKSIDVETTTINNILKQYQIDPYILKIDCEGCEKDIIMNSDLSMFEEIYLEYHTYLTGISHLKLIDKLSKQGFKVKKIVEFWENSGLLYLTK